MDDPKKLHRRRILLEIETAIAPGRDMLRGIAKFSGEIHRWDIHHNAGNWALHGSISGPSHIEPISPDRHIDGVITRIYDEAGRKRAHELISQSIPVVDILGDHNDRSLPLVHTDDNAIAKVALRHLIEQGFGRFAFCGIADTRWSDERGKCFTQEAENLGVQVPSFTVSKSHQEHDQSDSERIEEWLKTLTLPLGIFVSCDHIAPLLLNACARLGFIIPEALAVVGVNNDTVACNVCCPTLSSIDASHFEVGYRAARLLNDLLEGIPPESDTVLVPPSRLVVRGSSGELAISDPLIARAARFINRNAGSPIGVDDVVSSVPLSRRELQRRFRSVTGRTIHASILDARMNIAKRLLGNPEYTVDAVAELSGFGSRQHFAKTFKTQTGVTPAKYRREQTIR
jgi:LacI family transcriptional regulator